MTKTGHVARVGEIRNTYTVLVGKPEGKMSLRRLRSRWVINFGSHSITCTYMLGLDISHRIYGSVAGSMKGREFID
jgi:hypothetical protein